MARQGVGSKRRGLHNLCAEVSVEENELNRRRADAWVYGPGRYIHVQGVTAREEIIPT